MSTVVEPPIDQEAPDTSIEEAVEMTTSPDVADASTKPRLNHKNFLNLIAYALNVIFVYGIGNAGWIDTPDNGELSRKYQTLVTPASTAFTIWGLIFVAQGAWAICQLLPWFRSTPMVQDGLSYWFLSVAAMQIGWTFAFAYEVIPLSLAFMFGIWISLMTILYRQYYTKSDGTLWEFWLLRFPFAVHAGWITAASALNVNVLVVWMSEPAYVQLAVAIVALAVLHAVSMWVLFFISRPNWTIACVLAWAIAFIHVELNTNSDAISGFFGEVVINGVKSAAIAVVVIICIQMIVRLALLIFPNYNPYRNVAEVQAESEGEEQKV